MNNGQLIRYIDAILVSFDMHLKEMTQTQRIRVKKDIDKYFKFMHEIGDWSEDADK